jgi:hypothetical protein
MIMFLVTIIDFIDKKKNKLRVRTDLKISKTQALALIFGEGFDVSEFSENLRYYLADLMDFYFSKHEIFEHMDNMTDNYVTMYEEYLRNYDLSNN